MRKRGREVRGVSGRRGGSRRWPRPLGRAPRLASVLLAREEDDRGGGGDGLGRLGRLVAARWAAGELGRLLLFLFPFQFCFLLFNLFCHCFEFKNNSNNAKNSSEYFILLDGLFQKLIKYFRGIWNYILII